MKQRIIKFRAWDGIRKKFLIPSTILNNAINPKYPYCQCTGLKDKNGKEIYEGDILNGEAIEYTPDLNEMDDEEKKEYFDRKPNIINCEVYWSENEEFGRWDLSPEIHLETAEVIGNIYENPELIKGRKKWEN